MLSKVVVTTSFVLLVTAPLSIAHADSDQLDSIKSSTQDMLEFMDKNSTAADAFETKVIKLGYKDDEKDLFKKETRHKQTKKNTTLSAPITRTSAVNDEIKKMDAKNPLTVSNGDYVLTHGGAIKMEHYFQRNTAFLNRNLPDESEYFKNTFNYTATFAYGEKCCNHKAIEAHLDLMHKGIWGKNGTIVDSEPSKPTLLKLGDSYFGDHKHQNGRPFVWLSSGWVSFSLNAIAESKNENVHYVKVGYFPFALGRGISLGAFYGLNRSLLGLYSYKEEKYAPGINVTGSLIKDTLSYDLYWSRFEERNRDLSATAEVVRAHYTPAPTYRWRGLGKDNDLMAARLKLKPINNANGSIELEPYVMYNTAPDQKIDMLADMDVKLGTCGLNVEQKFKNFEWGAEFAHNFGSSEVFAIDRNTTELYSDANGKIGERYTHVVRYNAAAPGGRSADKVDVTPAAKRVVARFSYNPNERNARINDPALGYEVISAPDRFRPAYKTKFGGWMGVLDAAYNFRDQNLQLAAGGGYASGDLDPDREEKTKTYKGFIGVNELYSGTRVKSVLVLDERSLQRPVITGFETDGSRKVTEAASDLSFTDLVFGGMSATWTPTMLGKKWTINPNGVCFWKECTEDKPIVADNGDVTLSATDKISKFLGTEINLLTKVELLKDFNMFINLAVFVPGQYYKDCTGWLVGDKDFAKAVVSADNAAPSDPKIYRLAADPAFHANVGFKYTF